jgi:hypothetical protein
VELLTSDGRPLSCAVAVEYETLDGTARGGEDYAAATGSLVFPAGASSAFVTLNIVNDTRYEPSESFVVRLKSSGPVAVGLSEHTVTIESDDAPPSLSISPSSSRVAEGHVGQSVVELQVALSEASGVPVVVSYATSCPSGIVEPSSCAAEGRDYVPARGELTIAAGVTSASLRVNVIGDTLGEPDEELAVAIASETASVTQAEARIVIGNDDDARDKAPSADMNGDGNTDLLWQHQPTGQLNVWFLEGTSKIGESVLEPSGIADTLWHMRGFGDFDGDGDADLLWHHQETGALQCWLMTGTTAAISAVEAPPMPGADWQVRGVADFDADRSPDILWQHQPSGELLVWLMSGASLRAVEHLAPRRLVDLDPRFAAGPWEIRGVADFNGDGQPDLLAHDQAVGELHVVQLSGTTLLSSSPLGSTALLDPQWQVRSVADFNRDGHADLLWWHSVSGELRVWFLDATGVAGEAVFDPGSFLDFDWQLVPR